MKTIKRIWNSERFWLVLLYCAIFILLMSGSAWVGHYGEVPVNTYHSGKLLDETPATNTMTPWVNTAAVTPMASISQEYTILPSPSNWNPEWFCGQGTPVGWKTVTPGRMWNMACGQCVNENGEWGSYPTYTLTPSNTVGNKTPADTLTLPVNPSASPSSTKTSTSTGTPTSVFQEYKVPGGGAISWYHSSNCTAPTCWIEVNFAVPNVTNGKIASMAWDQMVTRSGANADSFLVEPASQYHTPVPPNYDITTNGSDVNLSGTMCYDINSVYPGGCVSQGYTKLNANYVGMIDTSVYCLPMSTCSIYFGIQSGSNGTSVSGKVGNFRLIMSGWPANEYTKTALEEWKTPLDVSNYCSQVEPDVPFTDFGWVGGITVISYNCINIGPYPIIQVPWLATVCLKGISYGKIIVFGIEIYIEIIIIGVVAVAIIVWFLQSH